MTYAENDPEQVEEAPDKSKGRAYSSQERTTQ
jgi:hypothetical protein